MSHATKPSAPELKLSQNSDNLSMFEALKSQNEIQNRDLRQFIADSLNENATKLRNELRSDLNEMIENQKKECASFKRDVDCKLKSLENKLKSDIGTNANKISALQHKCDEFSTPLDAEITEKLEILNSLSKEDLTEIKRLSTKIPAHDQSIKANETKISELIDSSNFIEKQNSDASDGMKDLREKLHKVSSEHDSCMITMEVNQGRIKNKLSHIETQSISSDTRHRRLNLIFEGMPEKVSEDAKQEIVNLLRRSNLQCPPTADQISFAYRLGKHSDNSTRPILVAFKDQQIKDMVLRNAPSIKKSLDIKYLWINRDHPEITRRQIANTRRCYNLMKANGHTCKMQGTSITYEKKIYHYNDLNSLPAGSRLEDTRLIPCDDNKGLCFAGELCYVSNFYPAQFVYKRTPFLSAEQAFQWDKARTCRNFVSAQQIIECEDPVETKRIGDLVETTESWSQNEEEILKKIVIEKFTQNHHLSQRLLDSGYEKFYKCTTSTQWGTGQTISSRTIDTSTFVGDNRFGKILAKVRNFLQGQAVSYTNSP